MYCKICGEGPVKLLYTVGKYKIWKCPSCGFGQIFVDDGYLTSLSAYYDKEYSSGGKDDPSLLQGQEVRPAIGYWLELQLKKVGQGSKISVAEIGPGTGAAIGRYLKKYHPDIEYEAIEISDFVAKCLTREGLMVHTGRVTDPDIREKCRGKFDLVIGTEVIKHDPDPRGFASATYDMLKPGGRFAFTTGNLNGLMSKIKGVKWYYIGPPSHVSYFTPKAARKLFSDTGFINVNIWKVGFSYIELAMKYHVPGLLFVIDLISLPTGMTISAMRPRLDEKGV
jgi:SAM-dependent methyltransferase